jgi:hypothetical protein
MDSTFERCGECPQLQSETTFVLRNGSFEPFDSRLMPSPFSTFTLFVRLLGDGNRTAAARLLRDPTRLDLAVKAGFGATNARRGAWKLEYAEDNEAWPRWLALRHVAGTGRPLYIVHFGLRDGRWVILDWLEAKSGRPAAVRGG